MHSKYLFICLTAAGVAASALNGNETARTNDRTQPVPTLKQEADRIRAGTHGPNLKVMQHRVYQFPPIPPLPNPRLTPDRGVGATILFRREALTSMPR